MNSGGNCFLGAIMLFASLLSFCVLVSSQITSTLSPGSTTVAESVPVRQYLCDTTDKLITDVWSINNIIYLKLLHFKHDSINGIECRIFVYDANQNRFTSVMHFPSSVPVTDQPYYIRDVLAQALTRPPNGTDGMPMAPSILFFGPRNILRNRCQVKWLYTPANSQFCRFHNVVNHLYRVLAVVDQTAIANPNRASIDLYRMILIRSDDFAMTTVRTIFTAARNDYKQEILQQYVTQSILFLQTIHEFPPPAHQNVRFTFSNQLGMFIAWYPSNFDNFETDLPVNCAIMMPIKIKPYMQICSKRYNFVSFIEMNQTLFVVLPENQVIKLEHEYITKQYRIFNNMKIDLDQFDSIDFFQLFFQCNSPPQFSKLWQKVYQYSTEKKNQTNHAEDESMFRKIINN